MVCQKFEIDCCNMLEFLMLESTSRVGKFYLKLTAQVPFPPALSVQIFPSVMIPYTVLQSSLLMIGTSTSRRGSLMWSWFSVTPHPAAVTICPGSGSDPDAKAIV